MEVFFEGEEEGNAFNCEMDEGGWKIGSGVQ